MAAFKTMAALRKHLRQGDTVIEHDESIALGKPSEHDEQVAVFEWAKLPATVAEFPEIELLYAVPNAGKRTPRMGAWYKAEGLRPGVPDICLPVARGVYHGLYIEMKVRRNKPNEKQTWWLDRLTEQGNLCHVCYSAEQAIDHIQEYLFGIYGT